MAEQTDKSVVLAVETSGRNGAVAAGIGDQILAEISFSAQLKHSAELFPSAQRVLARLGKKVKDIEHLYIAAGPGSFTGLRIAVTMAKMTAFAAGVKIVAVNTMDVIATNATRYRIETGEEIGRIAVILDAKRKQFYIAVFDWADGRWVKVKADCLMTSPQFVRQFGSDKEPLWLLGEGLVFYKDAFLADGVRIMEKEYWSARAGGVYLIGRTLAKAGQFTDPANLVPFYLRRPEAEEKWEKNNP